MLFYKNIRKYEMYSIIRFNCDFPELFKRYANSGPRKTLGQLMGSHCETLILGFIGDNGNFGRFCCSCYSWCIRLYTTMSDMSNL